jgi:hypothetical protein
MMMIEKMARGIAANAIGADVWDHMASAQRVMFCAQACAALQAMLEPNEGMIEAGDAELNDRYCNMAKRGYRAMIRAALEEK